MRSHFLCCTSITSQRQQVGGVLSVFVRPLFTVDLHASPQAQPQTEQGTSKTALEVNTSHRITFHLLLNTHMKP